jgi:hypothetical protein
VQEFETLEAPLLRFECWPDECHAAHSITGAPKPGGTDYSQVFIVEVIHFAMSLIVDDCFSTVEQFWQASNVDPTGQKVSEPNTEPPAPSHVPVVLKRAVERPAAVSANLAGSYDGSIYDLAANVTTKMSPTEFQQSQGTISGYFTCLHTNGSFRGIIDDSRHLQFTVIDSARHITLLFAGGVQSDGDLSGSYCNLDQNGQCASEFGIWSVVLRQQGNALELVN